MAGPYRHGRIHILSERCTTCVFRPGNLMHLPPGRLQDLVESNRAADTAFACHQTIYGQTPDEALCRGYVDAYGDGITPIRLARQLGLVAEDNPPTARTQAGGTT